MSFNQSGEAVVHRIPCAWPLSSRPTGSSLVGSDSLLRNCYLERHGDKTYAVKRPGTATAYSGGSGTGQGLVFYKDMGFAMNNNVLYLAIGSSSNGYTQGNSWTSAGSATFTERYGFGCVVFNGQIFAIGGYNATTTAPCSEVWSTRDGTTWNKVASSCPWGGRGFVECVVFNGKIWLTGGVDSSGTTYYDDVWSSEDGAYWEKVTSSGGFGARIGFGFVALNNGMYVYGGQTSGPTYKNDVWYSVDGVQWQQINSAASWSARTFFQFCVHGGKMWVLGGVNAGYLASTYSSPDGITWTNTTALPANKTQGKAVSYGDKMYVMGGISAGGPTLSNTVYSSTDGAAWTTNTAASWSARYSFGCVVFKSPTSASAINAGTIWMIAGYDSTYKKDVYYMTLDGSLPASWSITTTGTEAFQFTTQNAGGYLIMKNTYDMYVLFAGSAIRVTDSDYPARTVPGVVTLDETVYVMDSAGTIYGSDLANPFTWQALNYVTAEYESDTAIAIAKHQNYVVALKNTTMQFFYDTGAPFGSPLAPVKNANINVGCGAAGSIVQMNNTLVFVSRTAQSGLSVVMLNGFSPVQISNPNIDRILNRYSYNDYYAFNIKMGGHDFYVLNLTNTGGFTLVYDFVEKEWAIWTDGSDNQWDYTYAASNFTYGTVVQRKTGGQLDLVNDGYYQDHNTNFNVVGQTDLLDFNSTQRKFMTEVTLIGDRSSTTNNITVYWTDDNYITFNSGVVVDMSLMRPRINRLGSFRRRAFKFVHYGNNPMRLEAFEFQVTPGGL